MVLLQRTHKIVEHTSDPGLCIENLRVKPYDAGQEFLEDV